MTLVKVLKEDFFNSEVILPTSKSYANRFLILAALNPRPVEIYDLPQSSDVLTLIELLRKIGLKVETFSGGVRILNSFPECEREQENPIVLETGDGGTTNRFISALLCLGSNHYILCPSERMSERPMEEFVRIASALGVQVTCSKDIWLGIQGPLQKKNESISIDAQKTTQILSAFAMVLDSLEIKFNIENLYNSEKYWNLTEHLLTQKNDLKYTVPVDFSSASYPMALAAVTGEARFPQILAADPFQADSALIEILDQMGANLHFDQDGLLVKKSKLKAFNFNCSLYPDLSPTLAFLAACADGPCEFSNTEILTHKETNRLEEIITLLNIFGVQSKRVSNERLVVSPLKLLPQQPVSYQAPSDHRMIMAAYLFMRYFSSGEIQNAQHVKKSFPEFFESMQNSHATKISK
jgi:3-phosphoshikimate 1-carboxyvinyltransferase